MAFRHIMKYNPIDLGKLKYANKNHARGTQHLRFRNYDNIGMYAEFTSYRYGVSVFVHQNIAIFPSCIPSRQITRLIINLRRLPKVE